MHSFTRYTLGLGALLLGASGAKIEERDYLVKGNALDLPKHLPAVTKAAPASVTISVMNRLGTMAVSTYHVQASGSPPPVGGPIPPGAIPGGQTASFVIPTNYAGNIALGVAPVNVSCASLIEFSNIPNPSTGIPTFDIDVSYVDGFTNAISCSCGGKVVTGCAKNLYAFGNACPAKYGNCCANPQRNVPPGPANAFFAPCAGKAFTYPNDYCANSYGACQNQPIVCCIGNTCPQNPGNPAC